MCIQMKRNVGNVSSGRVEDFFYKRRPRRPPFLRVESEGIGVTSSIRPIFIPARAKARRADWAPGPGVLVLLPPVARSLMCRAVMPNSLHFSATSYSPKTKNFNTNFVLNWIDPYDCNGSNMSCVYDTCFKTKKLTSVALHKNCHL